MKAPLKDPNKCVTRYEVIFIAPGRSHHGGSSKGFSRKKSATLHAAKLQLDGVDCYVKSVRYRRTAR